MKVRAIRLRIITGEGEFGFSFSFAGGLTIIRAKNSSGKSTLFNSLLYGLGMEELVGGRDERVLPYGVHDYFEYEDRRIGVVASEVLVEIENAKGEIVTLRRAIRHEVRQSKLIEVFSGSCLVERDPLISPQPTYLHDAGGAQREEGFHRFLEKFLGLTLPQVSVTSGGHTKLYLQTIFAAFAVEQKRGWTDYIAGIPFYGIREARTRVVEYLLGLEVFSSVELRAELDKEASDIFLEWTSLLDGTTKSGVSIGVVVDGVSVKPDPLFSVENVSLRYSGNGRQYDLAEHISSLRDEFKQLSEKSEKPLRPGIGSDALSEFEKVKEQIRELSYLHEQALNTCSLHRASQRDFESILQELRDDLSKNKAAQKLRQLGAEMELSVASGHCPTCHQSIEDSLLREAVSGPLMNLDENVAYLKSQCGMLERQIAGVSESIREAEASVMNLARNLAERRKHLEALRDDISTGAAESRAEMRRQVKIETEVEALQAFQEAVTATMRRFADLAQRMAANKAARSRLPKEKYSGADLAKISVFEKMFRANAGSFGYESAEIDDIRIHRDTLTPTLQDIELREYRSRSSIAHDSSASDFVRLIWAYLLAVYQASVSSMVNGNHLGILLFDEPGQHSMRVESQHALMRELSGCEGLQSIVAASFDESNAVFQEATAGIRYQLLEWEGRLIQPLAELR